MTVRDIMTENPIYIEVNQTIQEALDLLYESNIRHLPVVERGELRGILSDRDLKTYTFPTRATVDHAEEALERLQEPVASVMSGAPLSVNAEAEISEVIELMLDQKIGAVPVTRAGGWELIGIVSYVDVLKAARELF